MIRLSFGNGRLLCGILIGTILGALIADISYNFEEVISRPIESGLWILLFFGLCIFIYAGWKTMEKIAELDMEVV